MRMHRCKKCYNCNCYLKQLDHPQRLLNTISLANVQIHIFSTALILLVSAGIMARRSILRVALTSSIFEAKVREPPHVAKAYCIGDAGKGKVELTSPSSPLIHLLLCCLLLFLLSHLGLVAFLGLVYQDVERLCQLLLFGDNHHVGGD